MTAVEMSVRHEWRLVAPWWTWPRRGTTDPDDLGSVEDRRAVRTTAPVLQMYETPDLVNTFLAEPQRRLSFTDEDLAFDPPLVADAATGDRPLRRKLYLASHHRHYLVVCSLHCHTAGFPHARERDVCEAGFVVRRRVLDLPGGPTGEVARQLRTHAAARARRIALERTRQRVEASGRAAATLRLPALRARLDRLAELEEQARSGVQRAAVEHGPMRQLQGWVPSGVDAHGELAPLPPCGEPTTLVPVSGTGSWQTVDELPESLREAWYPLTALLPDPRDLRHDGSGETIFFGVVPTGSSDVDARQDARYDEEADYEIRCFVRRHRVECDSRGGHCSCPVTWSDPTETYRLAGFFDLGGTAHRPTTVQMPDLRQLRADTTRVGPGGGGGLRFKSPPESALSFTADDLKVTRTATSQANSSAQFCSFAIPLITIVAFFVLRLFLPIVVLVFQLWFLLSLRFCLPPEAGLSAGLAAELARLEEPGIEVEASAQAIFTHPDLPVALDGQLGGVKVTGPSGSKSLGEAFRAELDPVADPSRAAEFVGLVRGVFVRETPPLATLRFVPRVERSEVVRP